MMYLVPFRAEHLADFPIQHAQTAQAVDVDAARALENEWAVTVMEDGVPLACTGAAEIWPGRAYVWCLVSERVNARNFRAGHTLAKQVIAGLPFRRLEAAATVGFEAGRRWLLALGFEQETPRPARGFLSDGTDCYLFSRVREG